MTVARTEPGRMHALIRELFPICRSITGDGLRATLRRVSQEIPLMLSEVPTGTQVLDWTVPPEWNITDAYVRDARGERVIDFHRSNLHVVGYSVPVRRTVSREELESHLHSLPEHPEWIPYRTSYYTPDWGFCLTQQRRDALAPGQYEVCIDSTLEAGSLTYGECLIPGREAAEVLISCHCCHPSLANDNLSGLAVAVELARHLLAEQRRLTYRFLFIPGTIGSITWLARNEHTLANIRHGLVLAGVGDAQPLRYKRSRRGDALIDRAAAHVTAGASGGGGSLDFSPWGYDERQYGSPGFDLPVGCLMRSPHGGYPQYHTSADDLDFVREEALADSLERCRAIVEVLEHDGRYLNRKPKGEPQLGRRGLYGATGGTAPPDFQLALLWVLNLSDGEHGLLDIAERSGLPFSTIRRAAEALAGTDLLAPVL